jgi:tetratricopeptide (TPR) repeat protein
VGYHEAALKLYQAALALYEKLCGPDHPYVATALGNVATEYADLRDLENAVVAYQRNLSMLERTLGKDHPEVASTLCNLAGVYRRQGNLSAAGESYERALSIVEKARGSENRIVASILNGLASTYADHGDWPQASKLFDRFLKISEKVLGDKHPEVGDILNNIASLYEARGRYEEALEFYERSLAVYNAGQGHALWPRILPLLLNVADLHFERGALWPAITNVTQALGQQRDYLLLRHSSSTDKEALNAAAQCVFGSALLHAACAEASDRGLKAACVIGAEQLALNKSLLEEVRCAQAALEADPDTNTRDLRDRRQVRLAQKNRLLESEPESATRQAQLTALDDELKVIDAKLSSRQKRVGEKLYERDYTLSDVPCGQGLGYGEAVKVHPRGLWDVTAEPTKPCARRATRKVAANGCLAWLAESGLYRPN